MKKIWSLLTSFLNKSTKISDKVVSDLENELLNYKTHCPNCSESFIVELKKELLQQTHSLKTNCPKCKVDLITLFTDKKFNDRIVYSVLKAAFENQIDSIKEAASMLRDSISLNMEQDPKVKEEKGIDFYKNYLIPKSNQTIN